MNSFSHLSMALSLPALTRAMQARRERRQSFMSGVRGTCEAGRSQQPYMT